jgi:predicted transcriptional regulator
MEQTLIKTKPSNLPKARIEEIAAETAERLGYRPGVDLLELVLSLGHKIEFAGIEEHPESLVISADGILSIYLPEHTPPARDRFTVAHEIGHFILHHDNSGEEARYNRSGTDLAEVEANWFAAAFLMPKAAFTEACVGQPLHMVARQFRVSVSAAEVRARSLAIVTL